jgi:hypothetical protein
VELRVATPPDGHDPVNASDDGPPETPKRKRTTLPLGLDHERERPQSETGWGPAETSTPSLPAHGPQIGGVMISVAPPPRTSSSGAVPIAVPAERPTPRLAIDTDEADESDWMDEETAPGVTSGRR